MSLDTPRDLIAWTFAYATVALCLMGVSLIGVAWYTAVRMRLETFSARQRMTIPVDRFKRSRFRWGGLTLRPRPGADIVELHNRERGVG